ncbi:MAG: hypothetical protein HRT67_06540 [Flavobacteriaceae bacterium]|nr:hypothetical protein [Flavobacteriaceae bacterium]
MRSLTENEKKLLRLLLEKSDFEINIEEIGVCDIEDGQMGSLRFISSRLYQDRQMGKIISEMVFKDADNIPISVNLSVDDKGVLYELDIWKVDFSKVEIYPSKETLMKAVG